jgi:DNA-binding response OmpR family regulator
MKSDPKILLIEDDASIAAAVKKELQAEGYQVPQRRAAMRGWLTPRRSPLTS